jgi:hypothetical protein
MSRLPVWTLLQAAFLMFSVSSGALAQEPTAAEAAAAVEAAEAPASTQPAEVAEPAETAEAAESSGPDVVEIGAYLNDVQQIDLRANNYVVDFYLWFRWKNPDIDPSSSIEFVNHSESWGTIITKSSEEPEKLDDGTLYQSMHVQGRMSRKMDLRDYPFDRQSIQIHMEDIALSARKLEFKVESISVNPEIKMPGFQYGTPSMTASDYQHPTNFGDVREGSTAPYSRVTIALPISRPTINSFIKNLLPILLTVICCSFVFLMHPSLVDSRFQVAIFSIISIVALQITSSQDLPTVEYLTLLDILYLVAYAYCIAVIGALVWSTKVARREGGMEQAVVLDHRIGLMLSIGYLLLSGGFIAAAFSN